MNTNDAPDLTNKTIKKVYIKDGKRKMMTDNGVMMMPAHLAKKMFGKLQGGKYSDKQDKK